MDSEKVTATLTSLDILKFQHVHSYTAINCQHSDATGHVLLFYYLNHIDLCKSKIHQSKSTTCFIFRGSCKCTKYAYSNYLIYFFVKHHIVFTEGILCISFWIFLFSLWDYLTTLTAQHQHTWMPPLLLLYFEHPITNIWLHSTCVAARSSRETRDDAAGGNFTEKSKQACSRPAGGAVPKLKCHTPCYKFNEWYMGWKVYISILTYICVWCFEMFLTLLATGLMWPSRHLDLCNADPHVWESGKQNTECVWITHLGHPDPPLIKPCTSACLHSRGLKVRAQWSG